MRQIKTYKYLIFLLFFMAGNAVYSQYITTNPLPRTGNERTLYMHATNYTDLTGPLAGESIDSVTVGAVMPYFVMPQDFFNPDFNKPTSNIPAGNAPYDASDFTSNVLSTFTWGAFTDAGLTISSGHVFTALGPANKNYYSVNWDETTGVGTYYLSVEEVPDPTLYSMNCSDGENSIQVDVINKPTIEFASDGNTDNNGDYGHSVCYGNLNDDGDLNFRLDGATSNFEIAFTSDVVGNRNLEVRYTISCLSYSLGLAHPLNPFEYNDGHVVDQYYPIEVTGAGTGILRITDEFDFIGEYTITITHVRDRIADKSNVVCPVDAASFQEIYELVIQPIPGSEAIRDIDNQYHKN